MGGNLVKFLSIFWACATVSSLAQTEYSFVDPNGFAFQHFGFSVDIDDAGTRCVVGYFEIDPIEGPANTIWKVFVWDFVSNNWTLTATLEEAFFTAQPQAGNAFGESVAISGDGNRIVVGGSHHDGGSPLTTKQGKVWVFQFNGVSWSAMAELEATGT